MECESGTGSEEVARLIMNVKALVWTRPCVKDRDTMVRKILSG